MDNNYNNDNSNTNKYKSFRVGRIIARLIVVVIALVVGFVIPRFNKVVSHDLVGKDNIKITTDRTYKKTTDEDSIKEYFSFDDVNFDIIMLAAASEDTRITIEKVNVKNYIEHLDVLIQKAKDTLPEEREQSLQDLRDSGYNSIEVEYFDKIMQGENLVPEDMRYFYQEFISQEFLYSYASDTTGFNYIGKKDIKVMGQKNQISEYMYDGTTGNNIRFYELNALDGEDMYIITLWAYEKDFLNNSESYIDILESFQFLKKEGKIPLKICLSILRGKSPSIFIYIIYFFEDSSMGST